MTEPERTPYWRLSTFYFVYFLSVGSFVPYWSLYLKHLQFSVVEIGQILAIAQATKLFAPYLWGWIADHTGRRMSIIRFASFFCLLTFTAVFAQSGFVWMAVVMFLFGFFWNANLPQFEAVTLEHLGDQRYRYARIRLWGSLGFILAVVVLGVLLESYGALFLPVILTFVLASIWLMSLVVHERTAVANNAVVEPISRVIKKPVVLAIFAVCFLMQAAHGPYYTLYTVYLEDHGYSRSAIGQLWALGVIAEIIVFLVVHEWLTKYGARVLLLLAIVLSAIRWLLIGWFVDQAAIMIFAQLLHAASFGLYHAVSIQLIYHFFPHRLQGRGQALYSSLSFGAGGAIGALLSGYLWDYSGATFTFSLSASLCIVALLIAIKYVRLGDASGSLAEKVS